MFRSIKETAEILRISEATVLKLIHAGELQAVRLGQRTYRVHDTTLENLQEVGLIRMGDK